MNHRVFNVADIGPDPHDDPAFDPDIVLVADYLAGALDPDGLRDFVERLAADADFAARALPLIALRRHGRAATKTALVSSRQAAWDRVTRHVGLPRSDVNTGRRFHDERTRYRRFTEWARWAQVAAVALMLVRVTGIATFGYGAARAVDWYERNRPTAANPMPEAAIASGKIAVTHLGVPANDSARRFTLPDGGRVLLAPGATFDYRLTSPSRPHFGWTVQLRGDAELEVVPGSRLVTIYTPSGVASFLVNGRYVIHATDDELLVSVVMGQAQVKGTGILARPVSAKDGQLARVTRGARAEIVK